MNRKPNRLIREKSPYLLQHAYNPVDWYPWCEEAFEKARREDKPIFLSIGYSTCHWCHVMERESFEDPEIARMMNETFVCVKVDREERPDIDSTYMLVCQMMTGSGGWPLNVIMTPDKKPFFAATYIPKESRMGMMGMRELIQTVGEMWRKRRKELLRSADQVASLLSKITARKPEKTYELGEDLLDRVYESLFQAFDWRNGGFGSAPKFPSLHRVSFLLRYWKRHGEKAALMMAEKMLTAIRMGGIYDHLGYGLHRYSTDAYWILPHFEKMLYDQAAALIAYTEAYQATGSQLYRETASEIFEYLARDMMAPGGGFYSAEDAESEGEEGRYYLWRLEEVRDILGRGLYEIAVKVYGLKEEGNFVEESTGRLSGKNILHVKRPLDELARELGLTIEELRRKLREIRDILFEARENRVRPSKDDKILADWNGLTIGALSKAYQALGMAEMLEAAEKAAGFILGNMVDDGGLLHRFRDGEASIPGFLDDYAFMGWGLLELYQASFKPHYLRWSIRLAEKMIELFWDPESGGFYFTSREHEEVLVRRRDAYDSAYPSGNSVATHLLIGLHHLTGEPKYMEMAEKTLKAFSEPMWRTPEGLVHLASALDYALGPTYEIIIVGEPGDPGTREMLGAVRRVYHPNKVVALIPEPGHEVTELIPYAREMGMRDGRPTAYVCRNYRCEEPTTSPENLYRLLTE